MFALSGAKTNGMEPVVEKLTQGEPLSVDQLIEYLPALKEVAQAQLDNWAKGAAALRRYKKGQTVCKEGDFGSTAFFIVSGTVDIFIGNPLAHLRTRPAFAILFSRCSAASRPISWISCTRTVSGGEASENHSWSPKPTIEIS